MLTWTGKGAVATPVTVQIRLTRRFVGRVIAGAPAPTRTMSEGELSENLRYFTQGLRGPRTRPCTSLVLSGLEGLASDMLIRALTWAREHGVERVTLHHPTSKLDPALLGLVDDIATTVRTPADARQIADLRGVARTAVVLLDTADTEVRQGVVDALLVRPVDRVVFTWPLSAADAPPPPTAVLPGLSAQIAALEAAGVRCGIKGLPPCQLGGLAGHTWRSANRWYVDADHQTEQALLFFPDVVRWFKADACRWCAREGDCEGVVERWWREGVVGQLHPIERP